MELSVAAWWEAQGRSTRAILVLIGLLLVVTAVNGVIAGAYGSSTTRGTGSALTPPVPTASLVSTSLPPASAASPPATLAPAVPAVVPSNPSIATPAPVAVPPSNPPVAAPSAPPARLTAAPAASVAITTVQSSDRSNDGQVNVKTAPGATCTIAVSESGAIASTSSTQRTADENGVLTWAWSVTTPGTWSIEVRCDGAAARTTFTVR